MPILGFLFALLAWAVAATSGLAAPARQAGEIFRDCPDCPEMVVIPSGSFVMGSPASEAGRHDDEGPQRPMSLPSFALGKYPVTFAQWDACVVEGGCKGYPLDMGWGRESRPVINVSWEDAQAYIRWLNGKIRPASAKSTKSDGPYRLPSEAEWEYAARAGTTTRFWCGDSEDCLADAAVYCFNSDGMTQPVGSKAANPFGLFDMLGNVWQLTADCYGDYRIAPKDGRPSQGDGGCLRVVRGGSWDYFPWDLRSAARGKASSDLRGSLLGFRLVRNLP